MRHVIARLTVFALAACFAGCQAPSSYKWGATDDPAWSGRVGTARMGDVMKALGQPKEKLINNAGETKARWAGESVSVNTDPGSVEDYSVQRTEERQLWHDMVFDKNGVLVRTWMSDQRKLS